jgi:hypothetical protein
MQPPWAAYPHIAMVIWKMELLWKRKWSLCRYGKWNEYGNGSGVYLMDDCSLEISPSLSYQCA